MRARVILGRDGIGDDATPEDFDRWIDYVTDHIAATCGFPVDVEVRMAKDVQSDDAQGETDEERETVRSALRDLRDRWRAEGPT